MTKAAKILALVRNKTKRVNLAINPKLWALFDSCSAKEGLTATHKLEDLIVEYLDSKGKL